MTDSQDLLADYRRSGSDAAFRELVARFVDLVHSTALRLVEGDTHRAEDVTQTVFVDLARLARTLPHEVRLGGWMHRHTCFVAANTMRGERRRQAREREAVEMNVLQNHSEADFSHVAPLLDEAINELGEADRTAILLRFFEQQDFRAVGQALGSNEDAARMRVTRALEKLGEFLKRRGVTTSAASLGVVLTANAVQAAPVGLAITISTAATLAGTTATIATHTTMNWLNIKSIASIVVAAIAAGTATHLVQQREANRLRGENQQLIAQQKQLTAERDTALSAASQNNGEVEQWRKDKIELLRLRGEVGVLRQQTFQLGKLREENQRLQTKQAGVDTQEQQQQAALPKMNQAKQGVLAFRMFAEDNQQTFPTNFAQATPYLNPDMGQIESDFDIVYQGSTTNIASPSTTIVLKEKQAWQAGDGRWKKVYGFADGHVEVHVEPSGNFEVWESQHMVLPPANQ